MHNIAHRLRSAEVDRIVCSMLVIPSGRGTRNPSRPAVAVFWNCIAWVRNLSPALFHRPELQIVFLPQDRKNRVENKKICHVVAPGGDPVSASGEDSLLIQQLQLLRQARCSQDPTSVSEGGNRILIAASIDGAPCPRPANRHNFRKIGREGTNATPAQ